MQTVTSGDTQGMQRRTLLRWLALSGGTAGLPGLAGHAMAGESRTISSAGSATLAAVWQDKSAGGVQDWAGLLHIDPHGHGFSWRIGASLKLPTRGHGVQRLPDGQLLFAARRPGDWLVRWQPSKAEAHWAWMEEDRCFNGHVVVGHSSTVRAHTKAHSKAVAGDILLTTETDLENSQGCIGLRSAQSLEKLAEWSTHGMDPHELLVLPCALGDYPAGTVVVANGGIPTQSETGRSKKWIDRMEPSLVALHPEDGRLLGQWRLPDPRLSIRHLAWDAKRQLLGIALQAEHDDEQRTRAPIFAIWDGTALNLAQGQPSLAGYGGSVECSPGADGGFVVSCPKSDCTAWFSSEGRFLSTVAQTDVCPLALDGSLLWSGGGHEVGRHVPKDKLWHAADASGAVQALQFDNHWRLC
ncbi:DUF1513 domain-containing protein [Ottowia thiooxydans]|uniref:DUF1513 domain-containing protein n=1 Tax=Ottowia thiooxydans TaxID=219182 RepID=UPI000A01F373|nr:DUF1513 domain-containing protein [Ottowia thiooxydans]